MLPHPARMCKHMRWGLMQRFPNASKSVIGTWGEPVVTLC